MDQTIRVLVIEREPLFRRGIASSLETVDGFEVVATADARDHALRLLEECTPRVALIGTTIPEAPGVQLAEDIRRHSPSIATIVLSSEESDDELIAAIRAGASAYCGRSIEEAQLHELIQRSANGEYVINEQLLTKPYVTSRVLDQFRGTSQGEGHLTREPMPLTQRELEILGNISSGLTNAEIGYTLGISAQTVKNHVTAILRKLGVNDRTQAVVTALRYEWLSIDDVQPSTGDGPARRASNSRSDSDATSPDH